MNRTHLDLLYGGVALPPQKPKAPAKVRKPKAPAELVPTEASEQATFIHWLRAKRIPYCSTPNANSMSFTNREMAVRVMAKQKAQGLSPGFFDLTIFLPKQIVFLEMKRIKGGVVSEDQKDWLEIYGQYPYCTGIICYGADHAIAEITKLLKGVTNG